MNEKLDTLLAKIKQLQKELLGKIQKKEERFGYEVRERRVRAAWLWCRGGKSASAAYLAAPNRNQKQALRFGQK